MFLEIFYEFFVVRISGVAGVVVDCLVTQS